MTSMEKMMGYFAAIEGEDQRRQERHIALLIIARVRDANGDYACVVNNLSATGLKARFANPPAIGERLAFSFRGVPEIAATVRWVEGNHGGVEFDEPLDLKAILASYGSARLKRAPRFGLGQATRLFVREREVAVDILDVSLGGAKLKLEVAICDLVGHAATLLLPTSEALRGGAVRWVDGDRIGFQFLRPLTLQTFAQILRSRFRSDGETRDNPPCP